MSNITLTSTSRTIAVSADGQTVTIQQTGQPGPGVASGGTTGQVLAKASNTDYDTEWVTGGGGSSTFIGLTDTPGAFVADRIVTVNAAGNALEFPTAASVRTLLGIKTAALNDTGNFATAAQGTLADSAVQPGDLASVATTGAYSDLSGLPSLFDGAYSSLTGIPSTFTPSSHTHTASEITDFSTAADARISAASIGDLSNVTITGPLGTTDVLAWNGSNWADVDVNSLIASYLTGTAELTDISDVTVASASTGEVIRWNGSLWVNAVLAYSDLSGTPTLATVATSGDYDDLTNKPTLFDGAYSSLSGIPSTFTPSSHNLTSHSDVSTSLTTDGNFLKYSGGAWRNANIGSADVPNLDTSKITTGTFADARISEASVTQHEAALTIDSSQLTGTLSDARVAESNVTQHEAALDILGSQVSGKAGPGASFDGGGAAIADDVIVRSPVTEAGTVSTVYAVADQSGSVSVIVRHYAAADTSFASPTSLGTLSISTAQVGTLGSLSQAVAVGDVLEFEIDGAATNIERLAVRARI